MKLCAFFRPSISLFPTYIKFTVDTVDTVDINGTINGTINGKYLIKGNKFLCIPYFRNVEIIRFVEPINGRPLISINGINGRFRYFVDT